MIITLLLTILIPAICLFINHRFPKIKAIVLAYVFGVLAGNLIPGYLDNEILNHTTTAGVLIAIPLLLFPTDVKQWLSQPKKVMLGFLLAVSSTLLAVFATWFLFRGQLEHPALSAGMLAGVYTGGTINLNAIAFAFNDSSEHILLMNSYDMIISGAYLFILMSFLPKLLSKFLPSGERQGHSTFTEDFRQFAKLPTSRKTRNILIGLAASFATIGISLGMSFLFTGRLHEVLIIGSISALALAGSFYKPLRNKKGHIETAEFFMLVFGFSIGAQANIQSLVTTDATLFNFMLTAFILIVIIHIVLSMFFRVDKDAFAISSGAAILGPPFIGPIADAIDNRFLIAPGIIVAIIGNVVGTYLGILVVYLLS